MNEKASDAFRTISEVADLLDIPPHVLRFWETKFSALRPLKRSGGRRYYRPDDVAVLRRIKQLLYDDGFTIKGAQKLVRGKAAASLQGNLAGEQSGAATGLSSAVAESTASHTSPASRPDTVSAEAVQALAAALALLEDVKTRLASVRRQIQA